MKKSLIFVVVVLVVAGYWVSNRSFDQLAEQEVVEDAMKEGFMEKEKGEAMEELSVTYTDDGFVPNSLNVEVGSKVIFKNDSSSPVWPASAMHPTHRAYPESDITKCETDDASTIFDACEGIASDESWSFTFNEAGEWGYHDHLNPSNWGKIIVE